MAEERKINGAKQNIWRVVRWILGALFIYAGITKVIDPIGFANDIDNYKTVPWAFGIWIAFYLPWLEILCGLALVFRRLDRGAVLLLTALMCVFIAATIAAKARGLDITCGCFGHASRNLSFSSHLLLDLVILAGVVAVGLDRPGARQTT